MTAIIIAGKRSLVVERDLGGLGKRLPENHPVIGIVAKLGYAVPRALHEQHVAGRTACRAKSLRRYSFLRRIAITFTL